MNKSPRKLLVFFIIAAMICTTFGFTSSLMYANTTDKLPTLNETVSTVPADPNEIVPIIVKLKGEPVLARMKLSDTRSAKAGDELLAAQSKVIAEINSKLMGKSELDVVYNYTLLFNGFSFRGEYRLIEEIKKLPGVENCYRSNRFLVPDPIESDDEPGKLGTSVGWINADDMWALGYTGQGQTIAIIDTGIKKNHTNFATAPEQPHFTADSIQNILNNYNLCAEQRYTGGTLTGANLYHSAKIPYTFNYYSGNLDVSHSDANNDHGTHVSSIAAGNDNTARGVAYNAQIITMQVFQRQGGDWIDILAALEDCAYLGVDVLNMSLGSDCGFTEGDADMDRVYDLLSANGVNVAVASGNSGTAGFGNNFGSRTPTFNIDNGVVSTPGTAPGSVCVAASSDSAAASVTDFTSWGTTSDLRIKPEIMAPGANINAATDSQYSGGNYGTKSGTSMACPHIAGGMALVNQYVNQNFPTYNEIQKMNMVNTLLLSTAVPSKTGGTPYSPRAQGAGQADLTAAISTKAYLEVANSLRPKLELGDDDAKSGVFNLSFDVVNFGNTALTYTVVPYVVTENTTEATIGGASCHIMSHSPLNITNQVSITKPNTVTVPANGRTTVNVTVNVSGYAAELNRKFPVGAYIEGFITLDGTVDLSIPFLGFYGDWEYAAAFDRGYYYDQYLGAPARPAEWGTNIAGTTNNGSVIRFGENPFGTTTNFKLDRACISPNGDGRMDAIDTVHTYLLRNLETFRYEILDASNGQQYYSKDIDFVIKGVENGWLTQVEPVGYSEETAIDPWTGGGLANGTTVKLRMTGYMQSWDAFDPALNENAVWEIPVTIDTEAPQVVYWNMQNGQLLIYVSDNHYLAHVGVYSDQACTNRITEQFIAEDARGTLSILTFDVGNRTTVYVKAGDYAYNVTTATVTEGEGGHLDPVDLNGISFANSAIDIYEGSHYELQIVRNPVDANNFEVEWTSLNPAVATVTGGMLTGRVTGVSQGTTTVRAVATDKRTGRSFTASATVVVHAYPTINEALNVNGGAIQFTSTGTYPWEVDLETYNGRAVIRSTNHGVASSNSTVTSAQLTLEAGDKLSFYWAVSSESNYDKLRFFVNNGLVAEIDGNNTALAKYEYIVPSNGSYTFKWSYEKDSSVNSGLDTAWLDDVALNYDDAPDYTLGDVDNNGSINVTDALIAMRHAMGLSILQGNALLAADVNANGTVTMEDALLILRHAMGLSNQF